MALRLLSSWCSVLAKHDDKPNTFSNSLDIRLARTLVNLAAGDNDQVTIVDPCCGMGTVVLEGLALDLDIEDSIFPGKYLGKHVKI